MTYIESYNIIQTRADSGRRFSVRRVFFLKRPPASRMNVRTSRFDTPADRARLTSLTAS